VFLGAKGAAAAAAAGYCCSGVALHNDGRWAGQGDCVYVVSCRTSGLWGCEKAHMLCCEGLSSRRCAGVMLLQQQQ
jgi:hypothetical protein